MRASVVIGLALALAGALPAWADDCKPPRIVASVDMVPQANGTVLVPVMVAGSPHYFRVGTAAPMSSVTAAFAQQMGLMREHSGITMINTAGRDTNRVATLPDFSIGALKPANVPAFIEPDAPSGALEGVRAGTLGADILRAYDVDLDFGAHKMNLISRDHCDGQILFWKSELMTRVPMSIADDNKIVFPMTLDGHELQAVLSTGAANTSMSLKAAREHYDVGNDSAGNEPAGMLNDQRLYAHRFKSLAAGGLAVGNPRIVLLPDLVEEDAHRLHPLRNSGLHPRLDQREAHLPDLILGMSTLKQLHLYIAYAERALYISPVSATPQ